MRGLEQMSWQVVVRARDFREGAFLMMTRSQLCPWECAEVEGERHLKVRSLWNSAAKESLRLATWAFSCSG